MPAQVGSAPISIFCGAGAVPEKTALPVTVPAEAVGMTPRIKNAPHKKIFFI
jgi:hypothetical protein